MKNIFIYLDEGVSQSSFQHLFEAFGNHTPNLYGVRPVDHRFFLTSNWEEAAALIVFPGGRDLPYHRDLQGKGNARIRTYIERGGRFFGICAGGYYGSALVDFEKGGKLEVSGPRELAFFPGKALGPAYGKGEFCYESKRGVRGAQILWEKGISSIYYNGGCLFEEAEKYGNTEILARYHDLPNTPAAVVFCRYGKGAALLSGVHPEFSLHEPFFNYLIYKILT